MHGDFERCYRAVQSKDARFDGWFVTAVLTTRIYCRPSCPVRPPFARNVQALAINTMHVPPKRLARELSPQILIEGN